MRSTLQYLMERRVRMVILAQVLCERPHHQAAPQLTVTLTAWAAGLTLVSPDTGVYKPLITLRCPPPLHERLVFLTVMQLNRQDDLDQHKPGRTAAYETTPRKNPEPSAQRALKAHFLNHSKPGCQTRDSYLKQDLTAEDTSHYSQADWMYAKARTHLQKAHYCTL